MTVDAPNTTEGSVEETTNIESDIQLTPEATEPTGLEVLNEKIAKSKESGQNAEIETEEVKAEATEEVVKADSTTEEATTEEKPFEPTLSYKVRDEELKMDDWVKDKITSEEDQKMFQELYTRGHGLEIAKQERDELKTKLGNLDANLEYLTTAVKNGDVEGFINTLGLPKEAFIKYAIDELKYQEMAPEQKARVDQERMMMQQQRDLMQQNEQMQQQILEAQTNSLNLEIDTSLNSAQYINVAQSYDANVGRPGAFKQLVKERGIFHERVHGRELTVKEAIEDAIGLIGGYQAAGAQPNLSQQTGNVGTQPVQQTQPIKKPVLPNLQSSGTSPTKKIPSSIADLKQLYREKSGQL